MPIQSFFPLALDNTMYAEYKKCPLSFFRKYVQHLQGEESVDLVAGKAFAAGLEVARKKFYAEGLDEETAIARGMEALEDSYGDFDSGNSVKSLDRLLGVLQEYFLEYPMATDHVQPVIFEDGSRGIESSFVVELPIKHPIFDVPLLFTGRADMLVTSRGKLWVEDEKTTKALTRHTAASWDLRSQFTGYCYGFRKSGIDVAGAIVRTVAIQVKQVNHLETETKRSDYELHIWEKNFLGAVQGMVDYYKEYLKETPPHAAEVWPSSLAEGCMSYRRPCKFMDSCKSPNGEKFLAAEAATPFGQNIWLPHLQTRMPLTQYLEENHPELLEKQC